MYIVSMNDNSLVLGNMMEPFTLFYSKKGDDYKEINKTSVTRLPDEKTSSDSTKTKESFTIKLSPVGITAIQIVDKTVYLMSHEPKKSVESIMEAYTTDGKYLGYYLMENDKNDQIGTVRLNNDLSYAYQTAKINDDGKVIVNDTMLYIAALK